jgi:hypothetical protein
MSSKLTANVYKKSKKREIALSAHSSDTGIREVIVFYICSWPYPVGVSKKSVIFASSYGHVPDVLNFGTLLYRIITLPSKLNL